jgi:S-adenosylmethionine:tRNA-ribosyltransferase-isomerase (queuine synthetase)
LAVARSVPLLAAVRSVPLLAVVRSVPLVQQQERGRRLFHRGTSTTRAPEVIAGAQLEAPAVAAAVAAIFTTPGRQLATRGLATRESIN